MGYVKNKQIEIGTTVRLTRRMDSINGYFEPDSLVKVSAIDPVRGYGFVDCHGNEVIEAGWDCCELVEE